MLQLFGDLIEPVVGPRPALIRPLGEREDDDRDVIDAAPDDQRLRNSLRQPCDVGADFLVNAQDRRVFVGSNEEARGDDDAVVLSLRIDVLDAIDALDDVFERAGDKFDCLLRLVAVGCDHDVDHRHADLRLLLARRRDDGDGAGDERRDQQERRQRRIDECAGQRAGKPQFHGAARTSPSRRPERISTPSWRGSPSCTTTSAPLASFA